MFIDHVPRRKKLGVGRNSVRGGSDGLPVGGKAVGRACFSARIKGRVTYLVGRVSSYRHSTPSFVQPPQLGRPSSHLVFLVRHVSQAWGDEVASVCRSAFLQGQNTQVGWGGHQSRPRCRARVELVASAHSYRDRDAQGRLDMVYLSRQHGPLLAVLVLLGRRHTRALHRRNENKARDRRLVALATAAAAVNCEWW